MEGSRNRDSTVELYTCNALSIYHLYYLGVVTHKIYRRVLTDLNCEYRFLANNGGN